MVLCAWIVLVPLDNLINHSLDGVFLAGNHFHKNVPDISIEHTFFRIKLIQFELTLESFSTTDDFENLLRNRSLTSFVITKSQGTDELLGVVARIIHRCHPRG